MAITLKRAFKGKDVDMLTACGTIIEQAIIHKATLILKRANWADPFLPDLQTRIKDAFSDFLGIDNAEQLREATQTLSGIQTNALRDLAEFKIQITEDFKSNRKRRDEILNKLGFTAHHKDAQNKDQEALIELLTKFKKNMTTALQTEITNAGMAASLITAIIGYATMKGSRKVISQAAVKEFNEIYNTVISVGRISANFFKTDKAIQDKFSYAKTVGKLNQTKPDKPVPPTPA